MAEKGSEPEERGMAVGAIAAVLGVGRRIAFTTLPKSITKGGYSDSATKCMKMDEGYHVPSNRAPHHAASVSVISLQRVGSSLLDTTVSWAKIASWRMRRT